MRRGAARGLYTRVSPSPDGRYLLAERVHPPFSYLFPYERFPRASEVLDYGGRRVATVADLPLADRLPAEGVPTGPREFALGSGRARHAGLGRGARRRRPAPQRAAQRDRIAALGAPFAGPPRELARTAARTRDVRWLERDPRALVTTYDRATAHPRHAAARRARAGRAQAAVRPCATATPTPTPAAAHARPAPRGDPVVRHAGDAIWLRGSGYAADGMRPFLDRLDLRDGETAAPVPLRAAPARDPARAARPTTAARLLTQRRVAQRAAQLSTCATRASGALRAADRLRRPRARAARHRAAAS